MAHFIRSHQVQPAGIHLKPDAAVLGGPLVGDIHPRRYLDPAQDRLLQVLGDRHATPQDAVEPETDLQVVTGRPYNTAFEYWSLSRPISKSLTSNVPPSAMMTSKA